MLESVDLNRKCKLKRNENNELEPDRSLLTNDKSQVDIRPGYAPVTKTGFGRDFGY